MTGEKSTKQSEQGKEGASANAKTDAKKTGIKTDVKESGASTTITQSKSSAPPPSKSTSTKKTPSKKKGTRKKVGAHSDSPAKAVPVNKTPLRKSAETDSQKSTATPVNQTDSSRSGNSLAWVAILSSILALGLSGYAAYQSTLSQALNSAQLSALDERLTFVSTEQKGLTSSVAALKQKSANDIDAQLGMIRALEQNQSAFQTTVSGIELASKASTDDIKASLGKSVARWKLDEIQSLLSRVNQFYQLTGDKARAEAGLNLANAILATIDDPYLTSVKAALAEDLLRIQSDSNVDASAINSRLLALSALIPEMKLPGESIKAASSAESAPESSDQMDTGLMEAGKSLLDDLGSLVKYKNLDAPLRPSLDGDERFVLYELLQLKVQTAAMALMRHNNDVYQSQLNLAVDEINAFFDLEQAQTQTVLNELKSLAAQNVSLNIEPVSGALSRLNEVMILEK